MVNKDEKTFHALLEAFPAAIFIERDTRCFYVNRAAEDITGYSRDELLAMNFAHLLDQDSRETIPGKPLKRPDDRQAVNSGSHFEIKLHTKSGEVRWLDVTVGRFLLDEDPALLTTAFDVTERRRAEREGRHLRDSLTGLANYRRMTEIFDAEAGRTDRTGRPFGVVVLVLEGLRQISSKYGYLVTRQALCRLARIMCLHCRSLDTAVRLGEDEFAFVLPETGPEGAPVLGRRIVARLANDTEQPVLSCRFNVAMYPPDGKTIDEVLKAARHNLRAEIPSGALVSSKYSR